MEQEFQPAAYKDEYRERLWEIINAKIQGKEIIAAPEEGNGLQCLCPGSGIGKPFIQLLLQQVLKFFGFVSHQLGCLLQGVQIAAF